MKYLVSIIICAYNRGYCLTRALESIPKRDDIQIIIVNDASTDNTDEVIKKYIENNKDRNIKYILHKKNTGIGAARKTAQQFVEGEYFNSLDSDDWFYKDRLNKFMDKYLKFNYDIVYFGVTRNKLPPTFISKNNYKGYVSSIFKFIKTDFIKNNNIVWHGIRYGEDLDFDRQYWALNPKKLFVRETIKHYNFPNTERNNISFKLNKIVRNSKDIKNIKDHNVRIVKTIRLMQRDENKVKNFNPEYIEESSEYIIIK